jgi:hypothetical protein
MELEQRHKALDDEIAEASAHGATDDLKIVELKRQKLLLKDEVASTTPHITSDLPVDKAIEWGSDNSHLVHQLLPWRQITATTRGLTA